VSADGTGSVAVEGGTPETRPTPGKNETYDPGTHRAARGRLVLAADGKTVEFVPIDPEELEAVIKADEEAEA
jgi:hypothetical protein